MKRTTWIAILVGAAAGLVPVAGFANVHYQTDPNTGLHVNPSLKECDVQFAANLTQASFRRFVREGGDIVSYKNLGGARVLPAGDFELAVGYASSPIDQFSGAWNDTFHHPYGTHYLGDRIAMPLLEGRVGLGRSLDVGAYFTGNPEAKYRLAGAGLKWSFLRSESNLVPDMAASVNYGIFFGMKDTTVHALGLDYHASKTWSVFTPYVGVGGTVTYADERSPVVELDAESTLMPHASAGLSIRPWRGIDLDAGATLGSVPTYQVRVGYIF